MNNMGAIKSIEIQDYTYTDRYMPEHTKEALENYFKYAWEPGSFCMAVLCNDLHGAVRKADHINKKCIPEIVMWLEMNAPYGSYGKPELVATWLQKNEYYEDYQKQRMMEVLKK